MSDQRTRAQWWADVVTQFSGSWSFIFVFSALCAAWIVANLGLPPSLAFDPYPYLFLNWILTVVSTITNPLILLSQNRQNDMDRERLGQLSQDVAAIKEGITALDAKLNRLLKLGQLIRT